MDNKVVITRTFQAPLEKMWDMWTKAEEFQKWYGPKGATIPTSEMDVNVGGKRLVSMEMQTPNGPMTMWLAGEYLEITPMSKLSYTEVSADKDGNYLPPSAMGMPGDEPHITTVTIEFSEKDGATEITMTHDGIPAGSPGEGGWHMALDKLKTIVEEG